MIKRIGLILFGLLPTYAAIGSGVMHTDKQLRLYQNFSEPIDPAHIFTLSDMDFSYALASTLVEWDSSKQIAAGLAESWSLIEPDVVQFKIRKDHKWSDGQLVTAQQVQACFDRILAKYPDELRSLRNLAITISVVDNARLNIKLSSGARLDDLLAKLTEPNFGITRTSSKNLLDLSASTGAFYVGQQSKDEIRLKANTNWRHHSEQLPNEIIIRKPQADQDITADFIGGQWSNLLEVASIQPKEFYDRLKTSKASVWKRPVDKLLFLAPKIPSPSSLGIDLLKVISENMDFDSILAGLSGAQEAKHVFPAGYDLHVAVAGSKSKISKKINLSRKPVVVYTSDRLHPQLVANFSKVIESVSGIRPEMRGVPVSELDEALTKTEYDLVLGNVGMADPHADGVMSYYLESPIPVIKAPDQSLITMLDKARALATQSERIEAYKAILDLALKNYWFLPLAHYSTIGFGRDGVDLSALSESDESVTWSKVRFKAETK